jgi:lipoyl(octanoyl) transferase
VLLLLEHTPVITLGRNAKAANILASHERLAERTVEVCECDRGGDVTFHGPGQLVGYPIFNLREMHADDGKQKTLGAVAYVRKLEEVLIRTCADFGISTKCVSGLTGVWTDHDHVETAAPGRPVEHCTTLQQSAQEAKIAAIGVHISRAITSHGFALNVNVDLSYFNLIIPCGITSKPVTSMARELSKEVSMEDVAHSISRNFGTVFQSQMLWLESLDLLLKNSVGVPMRVPEEVRRLHKEEESSWA